MWQGNHEDITIMVLDKDIPGKNPRGGPCIRWIDNRPIRIDMKTYVPDDPLAEYRNARSKMMATVHILVNKTQGEKVRTSVIIIGESVILSSSTKCCTTHSVGVPLHSHFGLNTGSMAYI